MVTAVDVEKLKGYFGSVLDPLNSRSFKARNWSIEKILDWYEDATVLCAHRMMGCLEGKSVLEIGFGTGAHLIWLAHQGAQVTGIDISPERVKLARGLIEDEGVSQKVSLICQDISATDFPGETFDIIYGHDILMYLGGDYMPFAKKASCMLKNGGKLVIVEAMDGHPLARVYRKIFSPREFRSFTKYFSADGMQVFRDNYKCFEAEFFYLLAPAAFVWKNWITSKMLFDIFERTLVKADKLLLRAFPSLAEYCWRVVFEAEK